MAHPNPAAADAVLQKLTPRFPAAAAWWAHFDVLNTVTSAQVARLCARVALPRPPLELMSAAVMLDAQEEEARAAFRSIPQPTSAQVDAMVRRDPTAAMAAWFFMRVAASNGPLWGSPMGADANALWLALAQGPLAAEVPWDRVLPAWSADPQLDPAALQAVAAHLLAQKPGPPFSNALAALHASVPALRLPAAPLGDAQGSAWVAWWKGLEPGAQGVVLALAEHAALWTSGAPTRRWQTEAATRVAAAGGPLVRAWAESGIRALVDSAPGPAGSGPVGAAPSGRFQQAMDLEGDVVLGWVPDTLLCVHNARVLRAALWMATRLAELPVDRLEAAAQAAWTKVKDHGARAPAVALGAVALLGEHADADAALEALDRLSQSHRGPQAQKAVAKARDTALQRAPSARRSQKP